MPLYDYTCKACGREFEVLTRKPDEQPSCPACRGTDLERRFPMPVVKSETTKAAALRAAKKRDKAQGTERVQEQLKYERSHND
jgi:putative FmdB family regulatory protein